MKIADKSTTAVSLVEEALKKAEKYSDYHVFNFLDGETAIKKATDIDARIKKGEPVGRLAGVPFAIKDNFLAPIGETTASAKILEGFASPITATVVKKLEAEDAVLIGRTNLDSFAHGSSTENSYYGPTLNSADQTCVAGGSSGGSAVAVALDIVPFTTGTDTGGSIRQPASFNGVYGLKPTYGAVSRYGIVAMASSTDSIGFFTRTPEDMDLLMSICAGQDPYDMTTLPDFYDTNADDSSETRPQANSSNHSFEVRSQSRREAASDPATAGVASVPKKNVRTIGIIRDFDNDTVHPEIRKTLKTKLKQLQDKGHKIVELDMPMLKYALAVYYIVVPAEIASNLSRHDGVRYGFRSDDIKSLDDVYGNTRNEGFMPENKRRIMIGNFVLSSGFYDAYYLKAQKARTLIINEYAKAFEQCDFILTPVAPNPPFKLGAKTGDPVAMYLEDVMSTPVNLAGLPALAVPASHTSDGLPIGLQIIGPRRSDASIINFAKELA